MATRQEFSQHASSLPSPVPTEPSYVTSRSLLTPTQKFKVSLNFETLFNIYIYWDLTFLDSELYYIILFIISLPGNESGLRARLISNGG